MFAHRLGTCVIHLPSSLLPLTSSQYSYYGVVIRLARSCIRLIRIPIRLIPDTSHLQPVTPIYTRLSSGGSLSVTLPLHFPNTSPMFHRFLITQMPLFGFPFQGRSGGSLGEVFYKHFPSRNPFLHGLSERFGEVGRSFSKFHLFIDRLLLSLGRFSLFS